jgi:hypothetical protein
MNHALFWPFTVRAPLSDKGLTQRRKVAKKMAVFLEIHGGKFISVSVFFAPLRLCVKFPFL